MRTGPRRCWSRMVSHSTSPLPRRPMCALKSKRKTNSNNQSSTNLGVIMRLQKLTILAVLAVCSAASAPVAGAAILKKIVAVATFENKTTWQGQVSIGDGMADQLTDALMQSGQFVVMERQALKEVITEQDLA